MYLLCIIYYASLCYIMVWRSIIVQNIKQLAMRVISLKTCDLPALYFGY